MTDFYKGYSFLFWRRDMVFFVFLFLLFLAAGHSKVYSQCDIGGSVIQVNTFPWSETGLTTCGAGNNLNQENTISCGVSSYLNSEEVVVVFTAPYDSLFHITLTNASHSWTSIKVFHGCPLDGAGGECVANNAGSGSERLLAVDLEEDNTYYLVISRWGDDCFGFDLSIDLPLTCPEPGTPGWDAISLPFAQTGLTTCGMGNDFQGYNAISCGSGNYLNSFDRVFVFEAPSSDFYHITLNNASESWAGMKLYDGCPFLDQGGTCIGQQGGSGNDRILGVDLVEGQTYYLIVSRWYEDCFDFDLTIDVPQTCPEPGTPGWDAISLPFAQTGLTTCGMGNDFQGYNAISCGSGNYLNSFDRVFVFEAPSSDFYHITLNNASESWTGMKLYDGCPFLDQGGTCIGQQGGSGSDKILGVDLVEGQTYYLVVSRWYEDCFEFDLTIDVPQTCPEPDSPGWPLLSLPFTGHNLTTCGMGNDLHAYNTISCGNTSPYQGEEVIFIFEAPTSEEYRISLFNATQSWSSMKLYDGCPLLDQEGICIGNVYNSNLEKELDVLLEQGNTYYLVVSRASGDCFDFSLSINAFCQVPAPVVELPDAICPSDPMPELEVQNPTGEVNWYDDANLTVHLASGTAYTPGGSTSQVLYVTNTLDCESIATKVPVPVYSAPAISLLQGQEGIFLQETQINYAHVVIAQSSSPGSSGNNARTILGEPQVYPQYGNLPGAWIPEGGGNGREYIELAFANAQPASSMVVYETYHPGSIDTVWAFNPQWEQWEILWAGDAVAAEEQARIFQVNFPETSFDVSLVRLALNTSVTGGPTALDAVGLMNPENKVCQNGFITLKINEGENIMWQNGETDSSISFIPQQSETITVESTLHGCAFVSQINYTLLDEVSPDPVSQMIPVDGALNVPLTPTLNWINGAHTSDVHVFMWPDGEERPETPIRSNIAGMQITLLSEETEPATEYKWQVISNHYLCSDTEGPVQSFTTRDLPNLQVSNVQIESEGFVGQPVSVSFMVTNVGNATTGSAGWGDAVFLSLDGELDLEEDVLLGGASNPRFLLPGESYTQNLEFMIPEENLGSYHVIVATNYTCRKRFVGSDMINYTVTCINWLEETTLEDNLYVSETALQFTLPPLPDLEVTNFSATEIAFAGDTITLTYNVDNTGDAFALSQNYRQAYDLCRFSAGSGIAVMGKSADEGNKNVGSDVFSPEFWAGALSRYCALIEPFWQDVVYIADSDPGFLPDDATRLGTEFIHFKKENYQAAGFELPNEFGLNPLSVRIQTLHQWDSVSGYLPANNGYQRQLQVVIPNCIEGDHFLFVHTDHHNWVWESNSDNNMQVRGIQILATPPPDLIVSSIDPQADVFSGQRVELNYTIENSGAGKPASDHWLDLIYLSPTQELDTTTATLLRRYPVADGRSLEPDSIKVVNTHVTIPNGLQGTYYLIVQVNGYEMVCEFDMNNNISAHAIDIQLTPPPDLAVTSIDVPGEIRAETIIDFSFTVENKGPGIAIGPWTDRVYLSPSDNFVDDEESIIASMSSGDTLLPGHAYTWEGSVQIPRVATGNWYLYVYTDSQNKVYEHGEDENNIKRYGPFTLLTRLTSDLMVEEVLAPENALAGQTISYSFSVNNNGEGTTNAPEWFDKIFINNQPVLTPDAITLGKRLRSEALEVNDAYQRSGSVKIPDGLSGLWYLIVVADYYYDVENDEQRDNNLVAHPVQLTQPPTPDLVLSDLELPASFTAGDQVFITYAVTNQGDAPTDTAWFDRMMLSLTPDHLSSNTLGFKQQQRIVQPAETFTDSILVIIPPFYSGSYYFGVSLDDRDQIYEHNGEDNNITYYPVFIHQAQPADLIVEEILSPESAVPGRAASYTYTITNIGENTSRGRFINNVYLESAFLPDLSSSMLWGSNRYSSFRINPGDSRTFTLEKNFPGVKDGLLESFVLANATQVVPEVTFDNNVLYADQPIASSMPLLPLNETISDTLARNSAVFYRLDLPDDADLRLQLQSHLTFTENALYMRYQDVPSGPLWDFRHSGANKAAPVMLIPGTLPGDNFLKIQSYSMNFQNITIRADILPFGIDSVSPSVMGQGRVTSMIYGAGFREGAVVELTDTENTSVVQGNILQFRSSMELQVRWQLKEVPVGVYNLKVTNPDGSSELLPMAVTVEAAREPDLDIITIYNPIIGVRNPATIGITFVNSSNVDVPYALSSLTYYYQHELVGISSHPKVTTNRDLIYSFFDGEIPADSIPNYQIQPESDDDLDRRSTIPLYLRDIAPGENISFSATFKNFPINVFTVSVNVETLTPHSFLDRLSFVALLTRTNMLTDMESLADLELNPEEEAGYLAFIQDEDNYLQEIYQSYISAGVLHPDDLIGYVFNCDNCNLPDDFSDPEEWFSDYNKSGSERNKGNKISLPEAFCEGTAGTAFNAGCFVMGLVECAGAYFCVKLSPKIFVAWRLTRAAQLGGAAIGASAAKTVKSLALACLGMGLGCGATVLGQFVDIPLPTDKKSFTCALVVLACDPNEIQGPHGYGDEQFIAQNETVNYTVYFENDPDFATAPAQGVRIEVPISENANPLSVRLGSFGFADYTFDVPANQASYTQRLDLTREEGYFLDVVSGLDINNNRIFWLFETIDPATGTTPIDPFNGFLAVNDSTGIGEGFVEFSIVAHENTVTGDTLSHYADIYFDLNPPITTNTHFNTIDAFAPQTTIMSLPGISHGDGVVMYVHAEDDPGGSGIDSVEVYVSRNGSAYELLDYVAYSEIWVEASSCDSLAFFARAIDNVGNAESLAFEPQAYTVMSRFDVSAGEDVSICLGAETVLTASEGSSWLWNNGETSQSITVSPDTTTIYSVVVRNEDGCPGEAFVEVSVEDCTFTVDDLGNGASVRLFPNPVINQKVLVEFAGLEPGNYQISLIDYNGRIAMNKQIRLDGDKVARTFDLSGLAPGTYILEMVGEGSVYSIKMVKGR